MAVQNDLAGLRTGIGKAQLIDHIIQPSFQQDYQIIAGDAGLFGSLIKETFELSFIQSVGIFGFLLFSELNASVGHTAAGRSVRTRRFRTSVNTTLGAKTPITL
jgi:hypothetical protein